MTGINVIYQNGYFFFLVFLLEVTVGMGIANWKGGDYSDKQARVFLCLLTCN